jgi:acetyl-CoA carboxylase carboxyltransferase component
MVIFSEADAKLRWTKSDALLATSLIEFDHNEGALTVQMSGCRVHAEESLIVVNAEDVSLSNLKQQLQWFGESNRMSAEESVIAEEPSVWMEDSSVWATQDRNSVYDTRLVTVEIDEAIDQLLDGEEFDQLLEEDSESK